MIISHQHKFIFMHCRKTAGTSVKVALSKHLGPTDLQLGGWSEARAEGVPFNMKFWRDLSTPRNVASLVWNSIKQAKPLDARHLNSLHKVGYMKALGSEPEHATASLVRDNFPSQWGEYLKFCFVRNPYEQAVSAWRFQMRQVGHEYPFNTFLSLAGEGHPHAYLPSRITNWPIYTIDDKVAVDLVGRYERLAEDAMRIFAELGLPQPSLPVTKRHGDRYEYRTFYGEDDRKLAAKVFEKEIETFAYQF